MEVCGTGVSPVTKPLKSHLVEYHLEPASAQEKRAPGLAKTRR